jgi:hypothetical protein
MYFWRFKLIIDLATIFPSYLPYLTPNGIRVNTNFIRTLRLLRLVRLLKMFRLLTFLKNVDVAMDIIWGTLRKSSTMLGTFMLFILVFFVFMGCLVYIAEQGTFTVNAQYPNGAYLKMNDDKNGVKVSNIQSAVQGIYWAVGGGTGMICHEFKGGIGTASRRLPPDQGGWTVGVLLQANHGQRRELRVDGYPVGRVLDEIPSPFAERGEPGMGSIVVIIATDAPLLPHQCQRLAQRASIGIARTGGGTEDASGDLFVAFSTADQQLPPAAYGRKGVPFSQPVQMLANDHITPLFMAAAEAVEEAIVNALVAGEDMLTADGVLVPGLGGQRLLSAMRQVGWRIGE